MSSRRHYERSAEVDPASEPEAEQAVGETVPASPGREFSSEEFGRAGDLEQSFATCARLANNGRQVKKSLQAWHDAFRRWKLQARE